MSKLRKKPIVIDAMQYYGDSLEMVLVFGQGKVRQTGQDPLWTWKRWKAWYRHGSGIGSSKAWRGSFTPVSPTYSRLHTNLRNAC